MGKVLWDGNVPFVYADQVDLQRNWFTSQDTPGWYAEQGGLQPVGTKLVLWRSAPGPFADATAEEQTGLRTRWCRVRQLAGDEWPKSAPETTGSSVPQEMFPSPPATQTP